MAKVGQKRFEPASDPGDNEDDLEVSSSDGSENSLPARRGKVFAEDIHEPGLYSPGKDGSFHVMFVDLFTGNTNPRGDGSCQFVKPTDDAVLEIVDSDVDKVDNLWGHCLLGCFAGRFPGLKAVRNLMDEWKTQCEILPHQSGWVVFQFQCKNELERILAGGPYFIYDRTLLLRSLPEIFLLSR